MGYVDHTVARPRLLPRSGRMFRNRSVSPCRIENSGRPLNRIIGVVVAVVVIVVHAVVDADITVVAVIGPIAGEGGAGQGSVLRSVASGS